MRLDFVRCFVESTRELLGQILDDSVNVNAIVMQPEPVLNGEVMAVVSLAGEARGRVIFDMDLFTALRLAGCLLGDSPPVLTALARSSIAELSSMAIGRAVSRMNDEGTLVTMSPPVVISGAGHPRYENSLETLVAPIRTAYGEVRVNVTLQDME